MGAYGTDPRVDRERGAGDGTTRYVSIIPDEVELVELSGARPAQPRGWLFVVGVIAVAAAIVVGLVEVGFLSIGGKRDEPASIAALLASPEPSPGEGSPSSAPLIMLAPTVAASVAPTVVPSIAPTVTPSVAPTPTISTATPFAPSPSPAPLIVVVAAGDTLSNIAVRYGVPLADVRAANPQIDDPSLIRPGERILIPRAIVNQLVGGTHDDVPVWAAGTPEACYAYGWAVDPNDGTADVTVRILVDGRVRASVVANEYRLDLAQFAIGRDGTAGFAVDLARFVTPGVAHEIRVQAQDVQTRQWVDLNLTPRTLTCPAGEG